MGSHLDSQPSGGRYDGALGVAAALEVLRTLDDFGIRSKRTVCAVNFTNEEGARFRPALTGSSVLCGKTVLEEALGSLDAEGKSLESALAAGGFAGSEPLFPPAGIHSFLELHIEQGPILERERALLGAVTGIFGIRWLRARFIGPGGHSGTTPMNRRSDPVLAAARLIEAVNKIGLEGGDRARATVGRVETIPNSVNSIATEVAVHAETRAPTEAEVDGLARKAAEKAASIAEELSLRLDLSQTFRLPSTSFEPFMVETVRRAAGRLNCKCLDLVSGAGHDAANLAMIAPAAMIFVPCRGGLSHVPEESVEPAWAEAGANALLLSVLELALS